MYQYTIIQWLFTFYFYCFGGWCFESAYVSITEKKLTNRGFIRGPLLPIYGSGATMMMLVSRPFQDNIVLTYLAGCVGATVLEYITGVLMETLFKIRYWDYSEKKFNFQGQICLSSTLTWGLFTVLTTRVLQVFVEKVMYAFNPTVLRIVTIVVTILASVDFALCFKAAIDLRVVLERMYRVKQNMSKIQTRLEAIISVTGEGIGNVKDGVTEKMSTAKGAIVGKMSSAKDGFVGNMSELKGSIVDKMERLKAMVSSKPTAYSEEQKEELLRLNAEYNVNVDRYSRLMKVKDLIQRSMLRSNPHMKSTMYHDALEEIKSEAQKYGFFENLEDE